MIQTICKNCGNHFQGKFCNNCGEKVYTDHDKSIGHFLHETLHFFTHFDNKFFKTLLLIFKKPGELSLTYCNGARNKYYKPISLFFIGVILYLLFPLLQGLNISFQMYMSNLTNQEMSYVTKLANYKAMAMHISLEELAEKYDHTSPAFAKILLLIILPLTGIAIKILFPKKRRYFFDYLILGTEASCLMLYFNFFILPLVLYVPAFVLKLFDINNFSIAGDLFMIPLSLMMLIFWAFSAFKRFFEISNAHAFGKGLLFLFLQSVIIFIIYRLILFLTVLLFI